MPKIPISLPQVRTIGLMQPITWLDQLCPRLGVDGFGWRDFGPGAQPLLVAGRGVVGLHGSGACAGHQPAGVAVVLKTWFNWQNSHINKWGNDYWCMVQFGSLLALAATGWVLTSEAFITLLAQVPVTWLER